MAYLLAFSLMTKLVCNLENLSLKNMILKRQGKLLWVQSVRLFGSNPATVKNLIDLGFQISNPVIHYRPDPSCMSNMEARAEVP